MEIVLNSWCFFSPLKATKMKMANNISETDSKINDIEIWFIEKSMCD